MKVKCPGVFDLVPYLFTDGPRHGDGERPHVAAAQVLALALVAEELQLSLLLVVQAVAVAHLHQKEVVLSIIKLRVITNE